MIGEQSSPFETVSVVVPGELVVGPSPAERHLDRLVQIGVTAVLSLQETDEAPPPSREWRRRLVWARIPVADGHSGGAMRLDQLAAAVRQLLAWRAEGQMSYVHCYVGIGRSPTVCAAYLMAGHGLGLGQALARVKAARTFASPTAQQLLTLTAFARDLAAMGQAEPGV